MLIKCWIGQKFRQWRLAPPKTHSHISQNVLFHIMNFFFAIWHDVRHRNNGIKNHRKQSGLIPGGRCNRLRCPLARMSGLQCFNMGHNGHGITCKVSVWPLWKIFRITHPRACSNSPKANKLLIYCLYNILRIGPLILWACIKAFIKNMRYLKWYIFQIKQYVVYKWLIKHAYCKQCREILHQMSTTCFHSVFTYCH